MDLQEIEDIQADIKQSQAQVNTAWAAPASALWLRPIWWFVDELFVDFGCPLLFDYNFRPC